MADEATKLFATIGADIRDYEQKMAQADQIAKQTAASMQRDLDRSAQAASRSLSQTGSAAHGASGKISQMSTAFKDAGQELEKLSGMASGGWLESFAGGAFVGVATTAINKMVELGKAAVTTALQMSTAAYQVGGVTNAFEGMAGTDAESMLAGLREASKGMISDLDLMLSANKAMMLNVTNDTETMMRLLEVAQVRGRAMGLSTAQAFENIVTGIGRMSPLILDNLGILTGGEQAFSDYAASIGKTAEQLTDTEKRQMLVNKVLSDSVTAADDAADATAQLQVAWTNLVNYLAQSDPVSLMQGQLTGVATEAQRLVVAAQVLDEFNAGQQRAQEWTDAGMSFGGADKELSTEQIDVLREKLKAAQSDFINGRISVEQFQEAINQVNEATGMAAWDRQADAFQESERQLHAYTSAAYGAVTATNELAAAQARLSPQLDFYYRNNANGLGIPEEQAAAMANPLNYNNAENTAGYQTLTDANIDIANSLSDMRFAAMDTAQQIAYLTSERDKYTHGSAEWIDLNTQIINLTKGQASASKSATSALEEQRRALESLADAAFGLSTVTEYDVLATQFGAYDDKPDEYLRRLEDAVNNPDSPYKDFLGGRSGDEAKFYLMQQKEAWQNGRWDQLGPGFRRDESIQAMVDQVTTQYENDQARQAILDEVMSRPEIAALGFSQNDIAGMVGLPQDYTEVGADRATALAEGLTSTDTGLSYATTFQEQIKAQEELFKATGGTIAGFVAAGFTAGIDDTTAKDIANALFPYLEKLLNPDSGKRP